MMLTTKQHMKKKCTKDETNSKTGRRANEGRPNQTLQFLLEDYERGGQIDLLGKEIL